MSEKYQLEDRTLAFSVAVIKHCARLRQPILHSIVDQVVRSATSIGANYSEANNASSKVDFRNKIFIAKKEAAETKYWLTILKKLGDESDDLQKLLDENQELLMILQKITSTLRSSK